jgi:hypothetical protein
MGGSHARAAKFRPAVAAAAQTVASRAAARLPSPERLQGTIANSGITALAGGRMLLRPSHLSKNIIP